MEMTVDLFDSIINTSQDCVFWKDNRGVELHVYNGIELRKRFVKELS